MTVKSCKLLNIYAALTRSTAFNLTNKIDSTHFYSHRLCDPPRHRSVSQIKLCRKWLRPDDDHPASDTSTANLSVQPIFCPQQGGLISLLWDKISMYIEEYIVQFIFSSGVEELQDLSAYTTSFFSCKCKDIQDV